jgi:hypothetical protein
MIIAVWMIEFRTQLDLRTFQPADKVKLQKNPASESFVSELQNSPLNG